MIIKRTVLSGPLNIKEYRDKEKYDEYEYNIPDNAHCEADMGVE